MVNEPSDKQNPSVPVTRYCANEVLIPAIRSLIEEGHTATFCVRGNSMRPFLHSDCDSVVLTAVREEDLRVGDAILAEVSPQRYVLHRLVQRRGDRLTLRGDGNAYGTETCRTSDVIGRVATFIRGRKKCSLSVSSWQWRWYSRLWPSHPLARRLLLRVLP